MEGSGRSRGYPTSYYSQVLHDPAARDPRGYILPADQADFLTAGKFVNTLIKNGITVLRAQQKFTVKDRSYPAGSLIVKTAQAFRPHIIDMFEPQYYPDDTSSPGAAPRPPYDSAGYTLAMQMGVSFDRIREDFSGPFEKIAGLVQTAPGRVNGNGSAGYILSHKINDSFIATNRLLRQGIKVFWLAPDGEIFIPGNVQSAKLVPELAAELGLDFTAVAKRPHGKAWALKPMRIGLWDRYGGSMASGWVRWMLEKFEFDFEVVYPPALDAGDLIDKFDTLIFVSGGIPRGAASTSSRYYRPTSADPASIPPEFRHMLGTVSAKKTVPQLKRFLEAGGSILTIGSSTGLAYHLGLPVTNPLVERTASGAERNLPSVKFSIPGSILKVKVDNTSPLAFGLSDHVDVYFNRSPVYLLLPEAAQAGLRAVAWFDSNKPLRSGYARGQQYLKGGVIAISAPVGRGKLFLFGPEITFRAQSHGNFKFLFNGIYYGGAEKTIL